MSSDRHGNSSRLDGIQNILDGKFDVRQGLEELCEALRNLRCGNEFEAELNVVNGIHHIKEGLREIEKGLCELKGTVNREALREIKRGVCDIREALGALCEVLKLICCGQLCEAEEILVKAIKLIEKGLCRIEKGLDHICLCA